MNSVILVAYFLLSPTLAAWLVVRHVQRHARANNVESHDAARRYGRWLVVPWLVYGINILAVIALTASSASGLVRVTQSPLGISAVAAVALLPVLLIALVVRTWARSLGHPAGDVPISVTTRGWVASSMVVVLLLPATFTLLAHFGRVTMLVGIVLLVGISLVFFQDAFRWIWHTTDLPDDEQGRRLRALLANMNVPVRRILVIPAFNGATPNAFVSGIFDRRRYLFIAERLLTELPPEEVDAVVAHEIGHLVDRHVPRLAIAAVAVLVFAAALLTWATSTALASASEHARRPVYAIDGAMAVLAMLYITRRMSRRFEFEADEFSARAIGSPLPMANALRSIARENWLPNDDRKGGAFASHPTIRQRLERLHGLS